MPGMSTSKIEVSLVSNRGFWLLLGDEELFVLFADFPWFKQASILQLMTIERLFGDHLYWPLIDVDLALGSIRDPAAFPLVSKANAAPQPVG